MSARVEELLRRRVETGTVPGAVAILGSGGAAVVTAGVAAVGGGPMREDALMRIQSMTKPITPVAALRLVEAGRLGLDQGLEEWLPELADRRVLADPTAALDDTVPADRSITLRHLLTNAQQYAADGGTGDRALGGGGDVRVSRTGGTPAHRSGPQGPQVGDTVSASTHVDEPASRLEIGSALGNVGAPDGSPHRRWQ